MTSHHVSDGSKVLAMKPAEKTSTQRASKESRCTANFVWRKRTSVKRSYAAKTRPNLYSKWHCSQR